MKTMAGLLGKALGEQLVQAGIATEKQLEKAKEKPANKGYKQKTGGKRKGKGQRAKAKPAANKTDTGKIEVTEKAVTRQVSKKDKVNGLIKSGLVPVGEGQSFNFVLAGKLKQIEVSAAQAKQLADGELAIVKSEVKRDPYVLVNKTTAADIRALIPNRVLLDNSQAPESEDDAATSDDSDSK